MEIRIRPPALPVCAIRPAAGFSLVELIVTISLGAVLMAIGVPMFKESIGSNRLTGQANEVVAAVNLARSEAITLNQQVLFCRSADSDATANPVCAGTSGDWTYWLVRTSGGTVIRRGAVPTFGGAVRVTSNFTNDQVTFASDGLARTNGALVNGERVTICSTHSTSNNRRRVTLGAGSRVSTIKSSASSC